MMTVDEGRNLLSGTKVKSSSDHGVNASTSSTFEIEAGDEAINSPKFIENCIDSMHPRLLNLFTLILALGNAADAVEIICVGYIMSDIRDITTTDKEFLTASVFMGMLAGGLLCGYASDTIGRRPCLIASLFLNALAGFLSAATPNVKWLIACRLLGGLGIGASVPAVFSLGAELFPSAQRGRRLSMIAAFWMVGSIFVASVAWLMLGIPEWYVGWRPFAIVSALPALVALALTCIYLPESPRFLLSKGDYERAATNIRYTTGMQADPQVLRNSIARNTTADSGDVGILKLLFGTGLKRTTATLMVIWFTLSFGSYGISTWISVLYENVGISNPYRDDFIYALANLPGNIISILTIETYGRRRLLSYGMSLAALSCVGFGVGSSSVSVVLLCSTLFNCFSVIGWNSLDIMSCENFPTAVRTSAMGVLAASGRLGAISAQFVNGNLEKDIPLLFFVTSGCMVVGGIGAWLLPDDKAGATLSD